jgi:hypothetical protein
LFLILTYLGAVALTTWALLDVAQTPAAQVQTLPRATWALITVVPYLGPAAWFVLGRLPGPAPGDPRRPDGTAGHGARPLGPDDDPDFLRQLGRRHDHPE